jgi:hypothetical protein
MSRNELCIGEQLEGAGRGFDGVTLAEKVDFARGSTLHARIERSFVRSSNIAKPYA